MSTPNHGDGMARALELTAGSLALTGRVLALAAPRGLALLPLVVTGLLVRPLQGIAPPSRGPSR